MKIGLGIPYVQSTHSRRPEAVETRQLNRFLLNRFQLSLDARPQGAVYSTASLRSARLGYASG